jgi:4-aminobutyrate aminotransferase-like enzyme/Ser/Thr protein kinase RdoA (MazF antagonist)
MEPTCEFTTDRAESLACEAWGLHVRAESLVGFEDDNFKLRCDDGRRFVLKIAPPGTKCEWLQCQVSVLLHLAASPVADLVPRVIPTRDGQSLLLLDEGSTRPRWARLMSYLEGTPLAKVAERSPSLLEKIGRTLARLDLALAGFDHPGAHHDFDWDLPKAPKNAHLIADIDDPSRQALVERHLERFDALVTPRLCELEYAVIQNDGNDYNLLISEAQSGDPKLAGLIDFGDVLFTATIAELAISCAYLMLDRDNPLDDAAHLIRGFHSIRPLTRLEGELLPDLIIGRLCTSLLFSAKGRRSNPDNAYLQVSEAPMWRLLEGMTMDQRDLFSETIARVCSAAPTRSITEILSIRRNHVGPNLSVSYSEPLKIVRGEGQYLYDDQGRRYLDLVNNVCHVGHCHPHVVAAGQRQMAELNTNTRYLHDHLAEYALRLTASFPDPLSVCFFVCTGTEANDLALRLARTHTGTKEIIVLEHAYHGHSPSLIEIGTYKCDGPGGEGLADHAHKAPIPDAYRGPHRGADAGWRYGDEVARIVAELERAGRPPGAFMAESLIGCGGQVIPAPGFMPEAFAAVRAAGGVCIADEVQVGFGRAGSRFWAFEALNVVPDIVTLGKPIGNGHPMAAVVTTPEIAESFVTGMEYFNTFGGNPVSCAIGLAVLEVIENEGLQQHARELGAQFLEGFREMAPRHRFIGDVRGLGLFLGVELVRDHSTLEPADTEAAAVIDTMRDRGFLLSTDGPLHNVIKIKPPMVLTAEDVAAMLENIDEVLGEIESTT